MIPESLYANREQIPYLNDIAHATELAGKYHVPVEDVLMIGLNLSGVCYGNVKNDRGRFSIIMPSGKSYYVALTITDTLSNFIHDGSTVSLGNEIIGNVTEIEKDTCTDSYWRNRNHLTLNSNSRSICRGCDFCRTYDLKREDAPLTEVEHLEKRASELAQEIGGDFSKVDAIGIVTGCFPNEDIIVNHIRLIRKVFSQIGFKGEIQYIGSQIKNATSIASLIKDGPFALYLTLEVFSRREVLMKKQKSSLTLPESLRLLKATKDMGGESSFLYIAGLDPMSIICDELPQFASVVTRFPQLQTYQLYTPDQIVLRDLEAGSLDYYLRLRQLAEDVFPDLRPVTFHNYRGLWYSQYRGESI
jgi:hypothetical protein